jgi:hypothetical protein
MEGGGEWSIPQGILSQVIMKLYLLAVGIEVVNCMQAVNFLRRRCDIHELAITYLTLQGISIALTTKLSTDGHM